VFDQPDVQNAEDSDYRSTFLRRPAQAKAKAGRHLHVDQFARSCRSWKNKHIVLMHVAAAPPSAGQGHVLRKKIGDEAMKNIIFLMDFEGRRTPEISKTRAEPDGERGELSSVRVWGVSGGEWSNSTPRYSHTPTLFLAARNSLRKWPPAPSKTT